MEGRHEERAVPISRGDGHQVLDGLYVAGAAASGGAVIAPPHPLYGGSMESPVVEELAHGCHQSGLASLRFDWRGVGGSSGVPSGEASDAAADYTAALHHLEETVAGGLVACGYSFGAVAALAVGAAAARIERLVLVSPPCALLDADALCGFDGPMLLVTGEHDSYAPPAEIGALVADCGAARCVVVREADHFYQRGLGDISRAVAEFL